MMKKQRRNIALIESWQRIGLLLALASLWIALMAVELPDLGTNGSSHLSSNATAPRWNSSHIANQAVKFYDLQLKLKADQRVQLDNGHTALLRKGTTISLSVTDKIIGQETSPEKVNLARILDTIRNSTNNNGINEFSIIDSRNRDLIGETSKINLSNLAQRGAVSVHNIEEEVFETGLHDINAENEGRVCVDCTNSSESTTNSNSLSIVEIYKRLTDPEYAKANPQTSYSLPANNISAQVQAYETSVEVQKLLSAVGKGYTARRGKRKRYPRDGVISSSIGACYNGVKTALLKGDMVSTYLTGNAASGAGGQLKSQGFINLLDTDYKEKITSPYDAPVGSVLVYEGHAGSRVRGDRNFQYGHIEIRTRKGFISDYFSDKARTGNALAARGRRLIGVYIKPNNNIGQLAMNETAGDEK